MPAQTTTNHVEIKRWAEERNGVPAVVTDTRDYGDGIVRLAFPDHRGADGLARIEWHEFFKIFDESGLSFLYVPYGEREDRFHKFVRAR